MKVLVNRLDYKNPTERGLHFLPQLGMVSEVSDINEVSDIYVYFKEKEKAEEFLSHFPKSYKGKLNNVICGNGLIEYSVAFGFNTFFMNSSTGEINESAVKRRTKVIEKFKSLGL
jgi:hypothetical protein